MCLNLLRLFQAIQVNLRNRSDGLNRILHRIPQLAKMFYDKEKMEKNIEKINDKNTINRMVEHGGREILSKGAMSTTPHTSEVKIMLSTIIPLKDLIAN